MTKRFFKLLYIISLSGILVFLPIYILSSIEFDKISMSSYKAVCNSNNQYVVLEGMPVGEAYIFDEVVLNDTTYSETKKSLNFYCKYYKEIQPYIIAYEQSRTGAEQMMVNKSFFAFEESVISSVHSYPELYKLEEVSTKIEWYRLSGPIIEGLAIAVTAFMLLQLIKICYRYVAFGEIVWHPLKERKEK